MVVVGEVREEWGRKEEVVVGNCIVEGEIGCYIVGFGSEWGVLLGGGEGVVECWYGEEESGGGEIFVRKIWEGEFFY